MSEKTDTNKNKEEAKTKKEIVKDIEKSGIPKEQAKKEEALDEKKQKPLEEAKKEDSKNKNQDKRELKKETGKKEVKKDKSIVRGQNIPISTKKAVGICKFIKGKKTGDAIRELEMVVNKKRAVPMKGEIPHKKGKGMSSGQYPVKAAENFIVLLKSLAANASEMSEPVVVEAIANIGSRPLGRFGRWKRKRTHVTLVAREKKEIKQKRKVKK